jgi:hypothetical protein
VNLDDLGRRLWTELCRRLEAGETRLYEEELVAGLAAVPEALTAAFTTLRAAGLVDWEEPGAYLYLRRPPGDPEEAAGPAGGASASLTDSEEELAQVYRALERATGQTVSSAQQDRMQEWLAVLGLKDVLDEIGLCRERGPCRLNQVTFALDKAASRRRRVSPFGAVDGRGVLPAAGSGRGRPGPAGWGENPGPEPLANASAYEPVAPARVKAWVDAHPELYADLPPGPPPPAAAPGPNPAARAAAYEPVAPERVRRWTDAFPGEYEEYRREYRRLANRPTKGPFRLRRRPDR